MLQGNSRRRPLKHKTSSPAFNINWDSKRRSSNRTPNDTTKNKVIYTIVLIAFILVSLTFLYQLKSPSKPQTIEQNILNDVESLEIDNHEERVRIEENHRYQDNLDEHTVELIDVKTHPIKKENDIQNEINAMKNEYNIILDNFVNKVEDSNINKDINVLYRIYKSINCDETQEYIEVNKDTYSLCANKYNNGDTIDKNIGSMKIISNVNNMGQINLYSGCNFDEYFASVFSFDECVHIYDWPATQSLKIVKNQILSLQSRPPKIPKNKLPALLPKGNLELIDINDPNVPSYHIVSSGEISTYMGYQDQSRYYGFLASNQNVKSNFTRLITAGKRDDISEYIPTFNAPRHPYSKRYGPLNKADVIFKWFNSSVNIPNEDIIIVIDPDNFIIRDVSHWLTKNKVEEGKPICEAAWFSGNSAVTKLWKEVCLNNCDWQLDLCAVPYIIHKNDLEKISYWFRKYILIMKDKEESDKSFLKKYRGIQMGWGTEMFGYIFGAAHMGIKHKLIHGIQIRDVGGQPSIERQKELSFIHTGRAWFPNDYEPGKKYWNTEGKGFAKHGYTQVWCKCNNTANDILPWPIPDDVNFQTFHTLYPLYKSRQYFGELPYNEFRKQPPNGYYHAVN